MRFFPTFLLPLLLLALSATPLHAQDITVDGNYPSSFEMVVDNCEGIGAKLEKATIAVSQNGKSLTIKIPALPAMKGKVGKRGKLRAEASGESGSAGIRAQYGLNGRVTRNQLQAVLVAEFFKGDKPLCTQSWSVTGKRSN